MSTYFSSLTIENTDFNSTNVSRYEIVDGSDLQPGLSCVSGCEAGEYGQCEVVDSWTTCSSCKIDVCNSCPVGKYRSSAGAAFSSDCDECETGKFTNLTGSSGCSICSPGHYASGSNYSETGIGVASGASFCVRCPPGKKQHGYSAYFCIDCEAGYSSLEGSTSCTPCSKGKYSPYEGSVTCMDCPSGKKPITFKAATMCMKCNSPKTSFKGSANCSICEKDYYLSTDGECQECPSHGNCDRGTTTRDMKVQTGYYRFTPDSENIYKCPFDGTCIKTSFNSTNQTQTGDDICITNGKGPLCSYCETNFYLDTYTASCKNCPQMIHAMQIAVAAFLVGMVVLIFIRRYRRQAFWVMEWVKTYLVTIERTPLTLLWFSTQTSTLFVSRYSGLHYPTPFRELNTMFSILSINASSNTPLSCFGVNFYSTLLFTLFWWPVVVCVWILFITFHRAVLLTAGGDKKHIQYLNHIVLMLVLFHSMICGTLFSTFYCTGYYHAQNTGYDYAKHDNGRDKYIIADMSLSCSDEKYYKFFSISVLMAVFYVCIVPVAFAVILKNRKRREYQNIAKPLLFMVSFVYVSPCAPTTFSIFGRYVS